MSACQSAEPVLAEIATIISADPVLTSRVLHFVNSAEYAVRQEVRQVRQAVALLGADRLLEFLRRESATIPGPAVNHSNRL